MKNNDSFIINPHLDAERALTFDLTYKGYITADWSYNASAYYNHVSDAIMAHYIHYDPAAGSAFIKTVIAVRLIMLGLI